MANVKLDKRASLEFTLFEKFAWFLAEIEFTDHKKITVAKFQQYLADILLGGNMTPASLANILVTTTEYAVIEESRFKIFCEKFQNAFQGLSIERQEYYKAINSGFIEWKNRIFIKHGWEIPTSEFEDDILAEQSPIKPSIDNMTAEASHVIKLIEKSYINLSDEKHFYEAWIFRKWQQSVNTRLNKKAKAIMPKLLAYLSDQFCDGGFDVFTIQNEHIAKKRLYFESVKQSNTFQLSGHFYSDNSQELGLGKFQYNFEDDILIIGSDRYSTSLENAISAYVFNIPSEEIFNHEIISPINLCYGYLIVAPNIKATELNIKFAAATYVWNDKKDVPSINEFVLNDDRIPNKIRSFLIGEKETSAAGINNNFIQKSIAHFLYYIGYKF